MPLVWKQSTTFFIIIIIGFTRRDIGLSYAGQNIYIYLFIYLFTYLFTFFRSA